MIIAGTGHRPNKLLGYGLKAHKNMLSFLLAELSNIDNYFLTINVKKDSELEFINGGAIGYDVALGFAAKELGYKVTTAVPFKGQEKLWNEQDKKLYYSLLDKSDSVITICEGEYAPYKMQIRNKWMVDNSDVILSLWNGSPGGTFNCINYARASAKPFINLWAPFEKYQNNLNNERTT